MPADAQRTIEAIAREMTIALAEYSAANNYAKFVEAYYATHSDYCGAVDDAAKAVNLAYDKFYTLRKELDRAQQSACKMQRMVDEQAPYNRPR